jgi:hypothetical protein
LLLLLLLLVSSSRPLGPRTSRLCCIGPPGRASTGPWHDTRHAIVQGAHWNPQVGRGSCKALWQVPWGPLCHRRARPELLLLLFLLLLLLLFLNLLVALALQLLPQLVLWALLLLLLLLQPAF